MNKCSANGYPRRFSLDELADLGIGNTVQMNTGCGPDIEGIGVGSGYDALVTKGFGWPDNGEFAWSGLGDMCGMCSDPINGYGCDKCPPDESVPGRRGTVQRVAYKGNPLLCCASQNKLVGGYTCDPKYLNQYRDATCDAMMFEYCAKPNSDMYKCYEFKQRYNERNATSDPLNVTYDSRCIADSIANAGQLGLQDLSAVYDRCRIIQNTQVPLAVIPGAPPAAIPVMSTVVPTITPAVVTTPPVVLPATPSTVIPGRPPAVLSGTPPVVVQGKPTTIIPPTPIEAMLGKPPLVLPGTPPVVLPGKPTTVVPGTPPVVVQGKPMQVISGRTAAVVPTTTIIPTVPIVTTPLSLITVNPAMKTMSRYNRIKHILNQITLMRRNDTMDQIGALRSHLQDLREDMLQSRRTLRIQELQSRPQTAEIIDRIQEINNDVLNNAITTVSGYRRQLINQLQIQTNSTTDLQQITALRNKITDLEQDALAPNKQTRINELEERLEVLLQQDIPMDEPDVVELETRIQELIENIHSNIIETFGQSMNVWELIFLILVVLIIIMLIYSWYKKSNMKF